MYRKDESEDQSISERGGLLDFIILFVCPQQSVLIIKTSFQHFKKQPEQSILSHQKHNVMCNNHVFCPLFYNNNMTLQATHIVLFLWRGCFILQGCLNKIHSCGCSLFLISLCLDQIQLCNIILNIFFISLFNFAFSA